MSVCSVLVHHLYDDGDAGLPDFIKPGGTRRSSAASRREPRSTSSRTATGGGASLPCSPSDRTSDLLSVTFKAYRRHSSIFRQNCTYVLKKPQTPGIIWNYLDIKFCIDSARNMFKNEQQGIRRDDEKRSIRRSQLSSNFN